MAIKPECYEHLGFAQGQGALDYAEGLVTDFTTMAIPPSLRIEAELNWLPRLESKADEKRRGMALREHFAETCPGLINGDCGLPNPYCAFLGRNTVQQS